MFFGTVVGRSTVLDAANGRATAGRATDADGMACGRAAISADRRTMRLRRANRLRRADRLRGTASRLDARASAMMTAEQTAAAGATDTSATMMTAEQTAATAAVVSPGTAVESCTLLDACAAAVMTTEEAGFRLIAAAAEQRHAYQHRKARKPAYY